MRVKYLVTGAVVLITAGVFASPGYAKIDPGTIVGLWLFDEDNGDEVTDSSGNGLTGVAAAGVLERGEGKFGGALDFAAGSRVHVEHNDILNLETFTMTLWIRIESTGGAQVIAVKQTANPDRNYNIEIWDDGARSSFASGGTAGAGSAKGPTTVMDGEWHHIASTYDLKEFKLYVDGKLDKTQVNTQKPDTNSGPFVIGAFMNGGNSTNGLVDEVGLFSAPLEEGDILAIMNNGLAVATGIAPVSSAAKLTTTWAGIKA